MNVYDICDYMMMIIDKLRMKSILSCYAWEKLHQIINSKVKPIYVVIIVVPKGIKEKKKKYTQQNRYTDEVELIRNLHLKINNFSTTNYYKSNRSI